MSLRWRWVALCVLCFVAPAGERRLFAAEGYPDRAATAKTFDIPAGTATTSLRLFAMQSGEQIIFSSEQVEGVTTEAVRGVMTPRDALARMLAGTPLSASQDTKSDALAVARREAAPAQSDPQPEASEEPPKPMKQKNLITLLGGLLALTIAPMDAQTAAGGGGAEEEVVKLSPFVVSTERDTGYQAASTLSGSRLDMNLKDVPASISVLTSEFLNDIAAVNFGEAIKWTPNLQHDASETSPASNGLVEFQPRYRVRGIAASLGRNYFAWTLPMDDYNVERIDQTRGPNSILFGVGSAGGIVNASTKQPVTGRRFTAVEFMVGSHEHYRTTLDVNQPLADQKAGLRLNVVWDDHKTDRLFEYGETQAAHLSGQWNVFKNTTLRAEAEKGFIEENVARPWTLLDQISLWQANGSPTFAAPIANAAIGVRRFPTGTARLTMVEGLGLVDMRGTMHSFLAPGNHLNNLITDRRVADYSIAPTGPGQIRTTDYETWTAVIEQRFGEKTFAELSYNHQMSDFIGWDSGHQAHWIKADPNQFLPNGAPNPHAGQFFLDSEWVRRGRKEAADTVRLTASTELDFGKFGNYRVAALGERQKIDFERTATREVWAGAPFGGTPEASQNRVVRRNYVTVGDWETYQVNGGKGRLLRDVVDPLTGRSFVSTMVQFNTNVDDDPSELETVLLGLEARYFDDRVVIIAGARRDRLENMSRGAVRSPVTNVFVVDYANAVISKETFNTRTVGVMYHARPWLSFHYNQSTNNGLPLGQHRIYPDDISAPGSDGEGEDYGLSLSLLNNRAFLKLNRYTTDSQGETDFHTLSFSPQSANDRVLDALVAAGNISVAEADSRRTGANAKLFDREADGYEVELVANPTLRWRIMASYTRSDVVTSNVGLEIIAWANEQFDHWSQFDTGIVTSSGTTIAGERAALQEALDEMKALDGIGVLGNRRDKVSFFTRYAFGPGRLENFYVGGGYRYQSPRVVGAMGTELLYGNSLRLADALVGYRKKMSDRMTLNVQLNVLNLFDFDDVQIANRNPDGTLQRFELISPREFRLTTRLEF